MTSQWTKNKAIQYSFLKKKKEEKNGFIEKKNDMSLFLLSSLNYIMLIDGLCFKIHQFHLWTLKEFCVKMLKMQFSDAMNVAEKTLNLR